MLDDICASFAPLSTFDPAAEALVVGMDSQSIGRSRAACWTQRDGVWPYLATSRLLPEWRGQGIGTALLMRARRLSPNHTLLALAQAAQIP